MRGVMVALKGNCGYIPHRGVETSNPKPDIINPVSVGFFMP
jgi:hypothetical protein